VDLDFKDRKLRELCEKQVVANRKFGKVCANKLCTRLADLQAVTRVTDLVAGNPHPLHGDRDGQFSVSLEGGRRLVFQPNHEDTPRLGDGGIDWSKVNRVLIVFVGDYHD